jgi:DNA polymerase I-like protein with 3'-5' exonuclease and polymerase domains
VYAGNYGIGALKLSRMHDMDFRLAKDIIEGYKRIRPELELWWRRIEDEIKTTRTLTNPLGRERIFLGRIDSALFRAAYDWICQSTVADLINQALVTLDEAGYECLLQVHDELVVQVENDPLAIAQGVKDVRNAMEIPVKFPNIDVPMVIPAEIAVGPNWYDVKEYGDG